MKRVRICSLLLAVVIGAMAIFATACENNSATVTSDMQSEEASAATSVHGAANGMLGGEEIKVVTFGTYEQDGDRSTHNEKIEWIVLKEDFDGMLLLSKYALRAKRVQSEGVPQWGKTEMYKFLNDTFYNEAFSAKEKKYIAEVLLTPGETFTHFNDEATNDPKGYVFLLSKTEVEEYLPNQEDRICTATAYAKQLCGPLNNTEYCDWWTRSISGGSCWTVRTDGSLSDYGFPLNYDNCVRPAIWIKNKQDAQVHNLFR
ncbi:MAG: hypothetical protein IJR89_05770 [Clostridia bacterium]|nr:hypothetical protein [Clostridia bacterium]